MWVVVGNGTVDSSKRPVLQNEKRIQSSERGYGSMLDMGKKERKNREEEKNMRVS